jgi:hypothetical protein
MVMTNPVARWGALLVLAVVLTGCEADRPTVDTPASTPSATAPSPTPTAGDPLPVGSSGAAAPGLEIRYLDEDGHPQVLLPKDFPRR